MHMWTASNASNTTTSGDPSFTTSTVTPNSKDWSLSIDSIHEARPHVLVRAVPIAAGALTNNTRPGRGLCRPHCRLRPGPPAVAGAKIAPTSRCRGVQGGFTSLQLSPLRYSLWNRARMNAATRSIYSAHKASSHVYVTAVPIAAGALTDYA